MSALTGALYAALVIYLGGWLADKWIGNFALLLLLLTLVTFAYWLAERLYFAPQRRQAAALYESQDAARRAELARQGIKVDGDVEDVKGQLLQQPWWLDWTAGLFPVIAIVFVLRSFLFEPFKIPSGSMIPTLQVGDLILVNKFHYGIRLPVINKKIIANHDPARGDVMVFHYPMDPRVDYIKRVVGLPGDEVSYLNKQLRINGELIPETPEPNYYVDERHAYEQAFEEDLKGVKHQILNDDRPAGRRDAVQRLPVQGQLPVQCRGRGLQGSAEQLLHDGRPSRRLAGFALLGLRAGREHRRHAPSSSG